MCKIPLCKEVEFFMIETPLMDKNANSVFDITRKSDCPCATTGLLIYNTLIGNLLCEIGHKPHFKRS
jgi:hypothetical protein